MDGALFKKKKDKKNFSQAELPLSPPPPPPPPGRMEAQVVALWMVTSMSRDHCTSTEGSLSMSLWCVCVCLCICVCFVCKCLTTVSPCSEASLNATIPSLVLNPYAWNNIANMIFRKGCVFLLPSLLSSHPIGSGSPSRCRVLLLKHSLRLCHQ